MSESEEPAFMEGDALDLLMDASSLKKIKNNSIEDYKPK